MKAGHLKAQEFRVILIREVDGKLYSVNNRRLFVFRVAMNLGLISEISAKILPATSQYLAKIRDGRTTYTLNLSLSLSLSLSLYTYNAYMYIYIWGKGFGDGDAMAMGPSGVEVIFSTSLHKFYNFRRSYNNMHESA